MTVLSATDRLLSRTEVEQKLLVDCTVSSSSGRLPSLWTVVDLLDDDQAPTAAKEKETKTPNATTSTTAKTATTTQICLERTFIAKNFTAALAAINALGQIAEREQHHPDFHLTQFRQVKIVLYTHQLGGVTQHDLHLAHLFDTECTTIEYSPKWLRAHPEAQANNTQRGTDTTTNSNQEIA